MRSISLKRILAPSCIQNLRRRTAWAASYPSTEEEVEGHVRITRGCYVCRLPGSRHGDHTIRKGCVLLLRVHGKQATRAYPKATKPAKIEF